ncbi:hypothetical protein WJ977_26135 [Achromobacter xylosoxidans]
MKKLALLIVLPSLLAGCTSAQMNMLTGKRNKTYNDVNAPWVGSTEEQLISKWGPPKKSYTLESGAKIISYEDMWGPISAYHVCVEKFMIEKGIVTKWGSRIARRALRAHCRKTRRFRSQPCRGKGARRGRRIQRGLLHAQSTYWPG